MPRSRLPLAFGEGLDRERGMMTVSPSTFFDQRNVLLHEGKLIVRPGYSAVGDFALVDRIVAGQPLRGSKLGIVVGYSTTTQRVYVYLVSPNGQQSDLVGEWEHDQGGWGAEPPRVITATVRGRIYMAHDQESITRRAATLVYNPASAPVLSFLVEDFDGNAGESGQESNADRIRFRGVVRHLQYLVGWGWGSDSENRPEMVRISLPGEPSSFDPNSYVFPGDRDDPVLACGPAGEALMLWKRTETHALVGTSALNFGTRLVDPRFGIVAARPWVNIGGVAVAWSEEGPRIWSGAAASTGIELPLGLREWEPADLVSEGDHIDAWGLYVPDERVAMFRFGRRVYALTVRVQGGWRWSWTELGFDAHCGFTLFGGVEPATPPPGYPTFLPEDESRGEPATAPAGTYADIGIRNNNQDGDETLEIWLAEVVSGSGGTSTPAPGVTRGFTDFSEFAVGGLPAGMTASGLSADPASWVSIVSDPQEGNYVLIADPSDFNGIWVEVDSLADVFDYGEILARVYKTSATQGRSWAGPAWNMRDGNNAPTIGGSAGPRRRSSGQGGDLRFDGVVSSDDGSANEGLWAQAPQAVIDPTYVGWLWMRVRMVENTTIGQENQPRYYFKWWTGAIGDEPAGWNVAENLLSATWNIGAGVVGGFGAHLRKFAQEDGRVSFLSFTTDPTYPPFTTEDAPSGDTEWFLARSLTVSPGATQVVRVEDLDPAKSYLVAARYRRGLEVNVGAEFDDEDPAQPEATWPSVSRGQFTTTADPATINSATWSRTASDAERITLDITPAAGLEDSAIQVFRRDGVAGPWAEIDEVAGPHVGDIEVVDDTISGEQTYQYAVSTADGALSDPTTVWSGPAGIPSFLYQTVAGAGYIIGFTPGDAALETELHDRYDDNGGFQAFALRATADAGETEVDSGVLTNVPAPDLTFAAKLRHIETSFTVDDYGEFSPEFNVTVPESE